jgi:predicted membrane protein
VAKLKQVFNLEAIMYKTNSKNWLGIILVVLGALFLLDNFGFFWFDISHVIFSWHSILLIIGIVVLINNRNSLAGYILIAIGLIGTLKHTIPYFFNFDFGDLWPIFLLLFGAWLIFKRNDSSHHDGKIHLENKFQPEFDQSPADFLKIDCIFNTSRRIVNSDSFKGGNITCLFGEIKLDLTNAKLAPGINELKVDAIFSGINIRVPQDWKVQLNVTSVFGGFDDKRYSVSTENGEGTLIINGSAIFGGGKLLN